MPEAPDKDLAKDGLLSIAPRDSAGRPTLGGIPLYRKLGQGGMGAVYLGKHPRLGVEVAVKILPFHLADQDPNAIEFFMREANVAARLNHPSLVRIFDVNVDGDPKAGSAIWYLVMEFVSGKTAGKLIKERVKAGQGPLPEADALDLLLTVTDGLAAAHEERFVHRDIKPENIIIPVSPEGEPFLKKAKLMDLGLAKAHSEELSLGPTGTNVAMGTPGYMSPEQAENAKGAGPPADVFAMGATLYNLLTGQAPFTGTTVLNVLKKTSDEPHVPIRQVNPAVSRPTAVLIDTCLSKRPEARYATAGILREALKACRQSLAGDATTEFTLASLQNLASIASADPTLRADAPSVVPSLPARTAATAKTPETAPTPAPAGPPRPRASRAPIFVALAFVALVIVAVGVGGVLFLKGRGSEAKNPPPAPPVADAGAAEFAAAMKDADAAMDDEHYDKAERLYKKAHQLRSQSAEAQEGERRARELKEQESTAATALGDADALAKSRDFPGAWQKLRTAIDRYPNAIRLRLAAARLALDQGTYAWLGLALNDAEVAGRLARPKLKSEAHSLKQKLEEKKSKADQAGGVQPQIQLAIDRSDWDAAEKLLGQIEPAERTEFSRAIDRGRRWQSAMAKGKAAESSRQWGDALAAYKEASLLKSDAETQQAVARAEQEVRSLYGSECDEAASSAEGGRFDDARRHLAAAENLMPAGPRHARLKDEIQYLEHLADARRLRKEGKNAEALAAASKALALRSDAAEAKAIVEELKREGSLALAKAALAAGDRAAAVRHARAAAAQDPGLAGLKELEGELWADLYVEKAVASARGPVDELLAVSDGRIVGLGAGFGAYAVWGGDDLKLLSPAGAGGSRPFLAALIEKDGLRLAGLTLPAGSDGTETQPVHLWENGRSRPLEMVTRGMKLPVTATRLAPFDGAQILRLRLTPGDERGPDIYTLDVFDTEKGGAGNPISARAQAHASIAAVSGGKYFATGGGTYRTWKREGGKAVVDERKGDPQVYLWSRDTFDKRPVDLGEPVGEGALLAFTPDGAKLLVATAAKKLFVIDATTGAVAPPVALPEVPTGLGASSGRVAVIAGRRVLLVRLDGASVAPATGLAPARSVLFAADGASLVVGGEDGLLRRYGFEPLAK